MSHCIWGLLSVRQLEFVHVSGYTRKLKGQSLYQLIHQEELLLARRDITKFITENKFGGSITRYAALFIMIGDFNVLVDVE